MTDLDDDAPPSSFQTQAEDNDPSEETQDFRFLAALTSKSGQLPKRGEKDFEPHGTKHQDGVLESSRQAMHDALSYTRFHNPKNHNRGFYYGEGSLQRDEILGEEWRKGLDDDHVVVVESARGTHFRSMGAMNLGQRHGALWLLPEEALYLVERGNLDLWWPTRSSFNGMIEEDEEGVPKKTNHDDASEVDEGAPMSLQAAFALLLGNDTEKGKVSQDRYTVYTNLKRNGYVVLRAPDWDPTKPGKAHSFQAVEPLESSPSIFSWLFGRLFSEPEVEYLPYGPLVKPGMYRSYNSIYRQIAVIPRHKPLPTPEDPATSSPVDDPYRVIFHLWKPIRVPNFTKSNPGVPDFRVAIVNARTTFVPSLSQVTSLLESTPWDPPKPGQGIKNTYQKLKHGWRNVVLAVIDQGVISYLRLGETAFGEEQLSERFDQGSFRGNKRGRGGGRGRGRGRGGRGRGGGR
ncbi:putative tRNA-splicing endonuclease subunit tsp-5 [Lachnellula hyalina]|uniref:Putative tRNA-splicing endonuclease subunit tsp-5 n=1 Tax=Lachnellula hyalina TaxID=1316788 RepID=A0A8H8R0B4_9HELO|nr:putative tRNA-splicing endonuclease subunit tsp-5 [Lachnellula hyalina]TVY26158.1 putative tRNA-splicing endonuclease subunit tsp-5 [Lachnellula hyalina]